MARVFWDTNLFIYLFGAYGALSEQTVALRRRMLERGDQLLTSSMTMAEVQVKPKRAGDHGLAMTYRDAILQTATVIPFDNAAAEHYASIRVDAKVRGADAIQLACASAFGAELFITNDTQLHALRVPGIHFIVPLARVPL